MISSSINPLLTKASQLFIWGGRGGGGIFIYLYSSRLTFFEIRLISKVVCLGLPLILTAPSWHIHTPHLAYSHPPLGIFTSPTSSTVSKTNHLLLYSYREHTQTYCELCGLVHVWLACWFTYYDCCISILSSKTSTT